MTTSHYVKTNGIQLHYLHHRGHSASPTLVLSHGLTANAHSFNGLVKAGLVPTLNVISVDLRGRGDSEKPAHGYSMADHAADMLGLLDYLRIEQAILGGHSFGGLLTYYMAANHPDRVSKCVVLDAPAEVDEGVLDQIRPSLDRLTMIVPSWEAYLTAVKNMPYYDNWWDPTIETYYRADVQINEDGTVQARSHPDHIQEAVQGTLDVDWSTTVSRIQQPLLLLRATNPFGPPGYPPLLPLELAERTIQKFPHGNAHLQSIVGNHITFLFGDSAKTTTDAIIKFVM